MKCCSNLRQITIGVILYANDFHGDLPLGCFWGTGLLLLVSEFMVVVLTFVRRPAQLVDRSFGAALVTVLSIVCPPLLRASDGGVLPDAPASADGVGATATSTTSATASTAITPHFTTATRR